jgi:outer membrane protein TolC
MHRWTTLALLTLLPAAQLTAQNPAGTTAAPPLSLSLDEALQIARANSPTYAQAVLTADPAKWAVRNAYGNFLPTFGVSGGFSYTGAGSANVGGGAFIATTPAQVGSNYNAGLNYTLNGATIFGPSQTKASQRATNQDIAGSETNLVADVTTQYLTVKQSDAQVRVQIEQVARNQIFLDLANAKMKVGQGTLLEVKQAEVSLGQAKVELLRRQQTGAENKLELFRRMGISAPIALDMLTLTDSFPVIEFTPSLDTILDLAAKQNPDLMALRERQHAAHAGLKSAKSEYFPTLNGQAGWSGYTQKFTNTTGLDSATIANNDKFPLQFTNQPFQLSLGLSLSIFNGFSRELRVSQARLQEKDLDERVRARALLLESDVRGRYLRIQTTYEAIPVQLANVTAAREQLKLAQDRYRLGSGNALEIADAQNGVQAAEGDYINAIFAFHQAIIALEAAVGHSLR